MDRVDLLKRNLGRLVVREGSDEERLTIFAEPGVENEPLPIRKAKALALLLSEAPIHIYPEELVVGIPFRERPSPSDPSVRVVPPEGVSGQGYIDSANWLNAIGLSDEPYNPVIPSLSRYGASDRYALFPHYATAKEVAEARRFGLDENSNPGHLQGGHARVIAHGWSGLKGMAKRALSDVDPSTEIGRKREIFLRSVVISLEAAQAFALRYADLAGEMAGIEDSPRRKGEVLKISEVCRRVAERAPESWWEALQLNWFTHLINHTQGAHQLGRFDQYMWPVLEKDLRDGGITPEEARELLECQWIKFSMLTDYTMDNLQNIILGGQTPDGKDATNPLSYMCMEATDKLETIDPKWSIRVHRNSPEEFLEKACEIIKSGKSETGIYNDETIIAALRRAGVPLVDARDYTNDGCSELLVQGKSTPWAFEGKVKLLKCLERVMARLEEYDSFDDLMAALKDEISGAVSLAVSSLNLIQHAVPKISPNPWVSASVEGCIEKMMDLTEGGAVYNYSAITATGVADTADSLAAVKKLVYEEARVGKRELLDALRNNFEGSERLRQMLLNRAPKFGNDDDYVDSLAAEIVEHASREVTKHRNPRSGTYTLGLFTYGEYIGHGLVTGATPDGRKAGTGISPNFSPSPGRDRKGPFLAMKSTAKVNQLLTANGTALDLTLHPSALRGTGGNEKLISLIRAFNKLGGMQVQFNIVDRETLLAAQREPDRYENLTVRLWGFPAYFTRLPREFQDHLIARTEHAV